MICFDCFSYPCLDLPVDGRRCSEAGNVISPTMPGRRNRYSVSLSGVQRASPSLDWVQEFRVVDGPYAGDNGRNLGSVVSTITKSGSNDIHGSVYEYLRNNAVDADVPSPLPASIRRASTNLAAISAVPFVTLRLSISPAMKVSAAPPLLLIPPLSWAASTGLTAGSGHSQH